MVGCVWHRVMSCRSKFQYSHISYPNHPIFNQPRLSLLSKIQIRIPICDVIYPILAKDIFRGQRDSLDFEPQKPSGHINLVVEVNLT